MVSYASIYDKSSKLLPTRAAPAFWTPGRLISTTTNYPSSVRELPLPAPQLLSEQESGLEGGRKVYVDLTTFVGLDPELYMTEYTAIRIVFTLQGLYTCTHLPRIQPGETRLSPRHQSTKLTATTPSCSRFGARPPARGRPGL